MENSGRTIDNHKNESKTIDFICYLKKNIFTGHWLIFIFKILLITCIINYFIMFNEKKILKLNEIFFTSDPYILVFNNYFLLIILSLILGYFYSIIKDKLLFPIDISILLCLIIQYINFDGFYHKNWVFIVIMYAIIVVFISTSIWLYKAYKLFYMDFTIPNNDKTSGILLDVSLKEQAEIQNKSIIKIDEETLGFNKYAVEISEVISNFNFDKSVSIGITGSWGSGKSSLVDLIVHNLSEKNNISHENFKIIRFNPWIYPDEINLTNNFLKSLKENSNDLYLHFSLDQYSKLLTLIGRYNLIRFFINDISLSDIKKKISNVMRENKIKYLFILDDIDRLEKDEILELAKLTRIIADFPNTIYMYLYNREYINNIAKGVNVFNDNQQFFDKIVNLEFKVPYINELQIKKVFIVELKFVVTNSNLSISESELEVELKKIDEFTFINNYLKNLRDIKIFINNFIISYKQIYKKITLSNFINFKLIFFKRETLFELVYYDQQNFSSLILKILSNPLSSTQLIDYFKDQLKYNNIGDDELTALDFFVYRDKNFIVNFNLYFNLSSIINVTKITFDHWYNIDNQSDRLKQFETLFVEENKFFVFFSFLNEICLSITEETISKEKLSKRIVFLINYRSNLHKDIKKREDFDYLIGSLINTLIENREIDSMEFLKSCLNEFQNSTIIELFKYVTVKEIQIKSNKYTKYMGSNITNSTNSHIINSTGLSVEIEPDKTNFAYWIELDSKFKILEDAKWISRSKNLLIEECDEFSATFQFEKEFILGFNSKKLDRVILYCAIDDFAEISINRSSFSKLKNGENILDVKQFKSGLNKILFKVTNMSIRQIYTVPLELKKIQNSKSQAMSNPYGLKYKMILKLKEKV